MLGIIVRQTWLDLLPTSSDDLHSPLVSIELTASGSDEVDSLLNEALVLGLEGEDVDQSSPLLLLAVGKAVDHHQG